MGEPATLCSARPRARGRKGIRLGVDADKSLFELNRLNINGLDVVHERESKVRIWCIIALNAWHLFTHECGPTKVGPLFHGVRRLSPLHRRLPFECKNRNNAGVGSRPDVFGIQDRGHAI